MPDELFRFADGRARVDLDLLYLPYLERVLRALARAKARGAHYYATRGTDSFEEQARLHGLYLAGKGGKAAPPGMSAHQFGIGLDFASDADTRKPGLQLTPESWKAPAFKILIEEIEREGLVSGASFDDAPHVQWPGFVSGAQLAPLRRIYTSTTGAPLDKLRAVWRYLDDHPPAFAGKPPALVG